MPENDDIKEAQTLLKAVNKQLDENENIPTAHLFALQAQVQSQITVVDNHLKQIARNEPQNVAQINAYTDSLRELQQMRQKLTDKIYPDVPKQKPSGPIPEAPPAKKMPIAKVVPKIERKIPRQPNSPLERLINSNEQGNKFIRPLLNTYIRLRNEVNTGIKDREAFENLLSRLKNIIPKVQKKVHLPAFNRILKILQNNLLAIEPKLDQDHKIQPKK